MKIDRIDGFREGHFYLLIKRHAKKDKLVDCGSTDDSVRNMLGLLDDNASTKRKTHIKGFFQYNRGKMDKCTFHVDMNFKILGINKHVVE